MNTSPLESKLYFLASEYYQALNYQIQQAQTEILFESYIFEMDEIGLLLLQSLSEAVARGVRVFLTVDGIGSWRTTKPLTNWCQKNKISFCVHHPSWPAWSINQWWRKLNQRNHRKFILIDQKWLFFGSLNISQVHLNWLDIGAVKLPTPSEAHWVSDHFFKIHSKKLISKVNKFIFNSHFIYFNQSLKQRFYLSLKLRHVIRHAQQNILLITPYFLPRSYLLRALFYARKRGVSVTILLPQRSDIGILQLATRSLYRRLLQKNISLFEYPQQILHSKCLLVDQSLYLGSFNFNHRSLLHDLEIIGQFQDPHLLTQFRTEYDKIIIQSQKIKLRDLKRDPSWKRLLGRIFYWFRYWL